MTDREAEMFAIRARARQEIVAASNGCEHAQESGRVCYPDGDESQKPERVVEKCRCGAVRITRITFSGAIMPSWWFMPSKRVFS